MGKQNKLGCESLHFSQFSSLQRIFILYFILNYKRVNLDVNDLRVVTWDPSQSMSLGTVQIISNDPGNIQISKRIFGNSITEIKCYF